jgi:hypothetical protein
MWEVVAVRIGNMNFFIKLTTPLAKTVTIRPLTQPSPIYTTIPVSEDTPMSYGHRETTIECTFNSIIDMLVAAVKPASQKRPQAYSLQTDAGKRHGRDHRPNRITNNYNAQSRYSSASPSISAVVRSQVAVMQPFGQPTLLSSSVANTTTMYDSIFSV